MTIEKILKHLYLFILGGLMYSILEMLFRGHTHWTMIVLGGLCFSLIGCLNEFYTWEMSLIGQMFISAVIITILEFVFGVVLNIFLGWGIWDYSRMPYNLLGQICLLFTNLWFLLSFVAIVLDDYLRYWFFGEEKPRYKIL